MKKILPPFWYVVGVIAGHQTVGTLALTWMASSPRRAAITDNVENLSHFQD
jgi:hypothetical protein